MSHRNLGPRGLLVASLLLLIGPRAETLAQTFPVDLQVTADRVFLSDGDVFGRLFGISLAYAVRPPLILTASAGMLDAVQTDFDPAKWYYERRHAIAEAGGTFTALRFESSAVAHELRFGAALSLRHRVEERQVTLLYPSAMEEVRRHGAIDAYGESVERRFYVFEHQGLEYGATTRTERSYDFGAALHLTYMVTLGPVAVQAHLAHRSYETGTPISSYGVGVGVRM